MKRIVFMGTAEFGIPVLHALNEHHDVAAVVTRCDSCRGRGRKLTPSPIKSGALSLGIDVLDVEDLREPSFLSRLESFNADLFIVVAFKILPEEVFLMPPDGTINLHASLLPDYRGAAPINWAIINGDDLTGLTTFYIEKKIDTGDVILNIPLTIGADETAGELADRMKKAGADLVLKTVDMIEKKNAAGIKQPALGNRPAPKLFKPDGLIDWTKDAQNIHNQIRGMNPAPGAFSKCSRGPLKIHRTQIVSDASDDTPGKITAVSPKEGFTVACGTGSLKIVEIQPPGKKPMDAAVFVRGYRLEEGCMIQEL